MLSSLFSGHFTSGGGVLGRQMNIGLWGDGPSSGGTEPGHRLSTTEVCLNVGVGGWVAIIYFIVYIG